MKAFKNLSAIDGDGIVATIPYIPAFPPFTESREIKN